MIAGVRFLPIICLAAVGCTSIEARVTSYLSVDLPFPEPHANQTVGVVAKTEPEAPLLEREVARKIEHLVAERGYAVRPVEEADFILFAFFAIDSGTTYAGSRNVYVPGGVAQTHVYTSTGQWATATTQLPDRTEQRSYSYTAYARYLSMTLYDDARFAAAPESKKETAVVWSAKTTSSGSSSDLRSVIDYLLVATMEEFGRDTGKQIKRTLPKGDQRVKDLRASTARGAGAVQGN